MRGPDPSILIVVLSLDAEPFRSIETLGQRQTWASPGDSLPNVETLWLQGQTRGLDRVLFRLRLKALRVLGAERARAACQRMRGRMVAGRPVRLVGDTLVTGVPETYINTNAKTVAAFRYLLATNDFDFLLRTNSSTYIDKHSLRDVVASIGEGPFYGGAPGFSGADRFASGAATLLSRSAVEAIVADAGWEFDLIDDVAIGRSMARSGIALHALCQLDVPGPLELQALAPADLADVFAVRCKAAGSRTHDVLAMHRLHELYRAHRTQDSRTQDSRTQEQQ